MAAAHLKTPDPGCSTDRHLSTLETIPTEIVQQVASYLIREDHDDIDTNQWTADLKARIAPDGICQLRATSKTLRAKTEHLFPRCLAVKKVIFDMIGLTSLYDLAKSTTYAPIVQSLIFVAPMDESRNATSKVMKSNQYLHKEICEMACTLGRRSQQATEVLYMMIAFQRLQNLQTVIVSESIQRCYSASVRQSSLAKHPPTMILAAAVTSKVQLQHIIMCDRETGAVHGIKPRILDGFLSELIHLNTLRTITLVLTVRNSGNNTALGLRYLLLASQWRLESLSLTIDMASVENLAPLDYSLSRILWPIVSTVHFRRLRALRLKGWEMWGEDIDRFMSAHKNTLVNLTIEDSMLMGLGWTAVLSSLLNSESLRSLKLFQLSEVFWRMRFPTTCETSASIDGHNDWSWVARDRFLATVLPCDTWSGRLSAIINDMESDGHFAFHNFGDAANWR